MEGRAERETGERRRLAEVGGDLRVLIKHLPDGEVACAGRVAAEEGRSRELQAGLVLGEGAGGDGQGGARMPKDQEPKKADVHKLASRTY